MAVALTLLLAAAGGLTGIKMKIPAGAMIGALFAVGFFNLIWPVAYLPVETKVLTQAVAGMFIGVSFRRKDLPGMKKLVLPVALSVAAIMGMGFAMGFLLTALTGLDVITCLFACAPGGVVDMALMADDMGGDAAVVSVLQMVRLVTVISLFPPVIRTAVARLGGRAALDSVEQPLEVSPEAASGSGQKREYRLREVSVTFVTALLAGIVGKIAGVPAGPILLAMLAVAGQNILFDNASMPIEVKRAAQMLAGALIGAGLTAEKLVRLRVIVLPALLLVVLYVLFNLIAGIILYRSTGIDAMTAFFALAPGGASDVALIAGDYGCHMPTISAFHMVRAVCVVGLTPFIISFLTQI